MTTVGYFLSSEEHGPRELLDYAVMAEESGFHDVLISDHMARVPGAEPLRLERDRSTGG